MLPSRKSYDLNKELAPECIVPLVSFPRSGNTWLRFLLANSLKNDENLSINYEKLNKIMPTSMKNKYFDPLETRDLLIPGSPFLIKEHDNYYAMPNYNYRKAIYIYRNRHDVLRSYWTFTQKRNPSLFPNLQSFIKYYGHAYGTWDEHVNSWVEAEKSNNGREILILRYEDLVNNTEQCLNNVFDFLGIQVGRQRIQKAVEQSSYDKMKKIPIKNVAGGNIIPRSNFDKTAFEDYKECSSNLMLQICGKYYSYKWSLKRKIGAMLHRTNSSKTPIVHKK